MTIYSSAEFIAQGEERQRRSDAAHPRDAEHIQGYEIDKKEGTLNLWWNCRGGYRIELSAMRSPLSVLRWLHHVGVKDWEGMTGYRVSELLSDLAHLNGWDLYKLYE